MKSIKKQISKGKQDLQLDEMIQLDDHKLRITIKSDSYRSQCYAKIYVWSKHKEEWSLIDSIHPDNMQTEEKLSYAVSNTDYKKSFHLFANDRKQLIDVAKKVLA
tara:strand:- start:320 stop:634 length:315 start_codon:yes stop_codon:yes gene_type:complete